MTSSLADAVTELAGRFSGQLLQPADAGYEEARKVHNGLIDKRPALIARCRGVADVVDAVKLARKLSLEVAVRGGGHNVAGRATIDGGLMIDLSPMKGIHVDPEGRTARAQGGVTWGELNRETQLHGLAVTGGVVSTTGIAGLTLGGGLGWLMGKYGLALDNLRLGRTRHRRRPGAAGEQGRRSRPVLGAARRRRQLRRGDVLRISACIRSDRSSPAASSPTPSSRRATCCGSSATSPRRCPTRSRVFGGLIHAPDGSGAKLAAMVAGHCGSLGRRRSGDAAAQAIRSRR